MKLSQLIREAQLPQEQEQRARRNYHGTCKQIGTHIATAIAMAEELSRMPAADGGMDQAVQEMGAALKACKDAHAVFSAKLHRHLSQVKRPTRKG